MLGEVLTAIVTPFHADGRVNVDKFRELCAQLVDEGSDGVVVCGTTGESPTLTDEEKVELWQSAVHEVGGRATVVAGTGTYSTAHSVHLTEEADRAGVDAFLVVTPYYNKPPLRGIVEHFRAIAEVSDKPIIAYNIPGRVVVNVPPATLVELAEEIPTVRAVKQANADLDQAQRIVQETDLELYAGDDNLVLPFLQLGGVGGHLRPVEHRRPAAEGDDHALPRGRRRRAPGRSTKSCGRCTTWTTSPSTRSRSRPR